VVYFDYPRLEALKDKIAERSDKSIIIWARFQQDIEVIADAFKGDCVTYYGKTDADDRTKAKEDFIARKVRYFISNPEVGGTGLDGLQKVCKFAVYYSNSFKAIPRWQSEDRIHRIGMGESPEYCDLIARGGPDLKLLANLRRKLALSDMVLNNLIMDADTPDDAPIEDIPSTTVAFDPGMAEVTSAFDRRRK
jgi:SNF2 family DNA or RNA helicase